MTESTAMHAPLTAAANAPGPDGRARGPRSGPAPGRYDAPLQDDVDGGERCDAQAWVSLPGVFALRLVDDYRGRGIDVAPTLAHFDIDATTLDNDTELGFDAVTRWTEHLLDACPQRGLGLSFGAGLQLPHLGVVGYAMLSSSTFGEAVTHWLRFGALVRPYIGTARQVLDDGRIQLVALEHNPPRFGERMRRYCLERWSASWIHAVQALLGPGRHVDEVHFACPDPSLREDYYEAFGCRLRFDQPRTLVRFSAHVCAARARFANALARGLCVAQCEALLARANEGRDTTAALRQVLLAAAARFPDLAGAAAAMQLAEGTLRRRLRDEGTTFTDVLHETRMALAGDYLRHTARSIGEIAALLQYGDESAFTRAFRRRHGITALDYRRACPAPSVRLPAGSGRQGGIA